jgi:hypothetical protein
LRKKRHPIWSIPPRTRSGFRTQPDLCGFALGNPGFGPLATRSRAQRVTTAVASRYDPLSQLPTTTLSCRRKLLSTAAPILRFVPAVESLKSRFTAVFHHFAGLFAEVSAVNPAPPAERTRQGPSRRRRTRSPLRADGSVYEIARFWTPLRIFSRRVPNQPFALSQSPRFGVSGQRPRCRRILGQISVGSRTRPPQRVLWPSHVRGFTGPLPFRAYGPISVAGAAVGRPAQALCKD